MKVKRRLFHDILTQKIEAYEQIDLEVIERLKAFPNCHVMTPNTSQRRLRARIDRGVSLKRWCRQARESSEVITVLYQLTTLLYNLEQAQVDLNRVLCHPKYVYLSQQDQEPAVVYLPVQYMPYAYYWQTFFQQILFDLTLVDNREVASMTQLLSFVQQHPQLRLQQLKMYFEQYFLEMGMAYEG